MPTKTAKKVDEPARTIEWANLLNHSLTTPGSVGNVYNRFYNYSFLNCMLLMMQGAREPVATYNRWQAVNRQVRKGEKAMEILRPVIIRRKKDDADPDSTDVMFQKFKFVRCIFQMSQTDGDDLPSVDVPEWNLDRALTALTVTRMPFQHLDGNTQGYSRDRSLAINPVAAYPIKTTMHEFAHILLGHTVSDYHAEYVLHRGVAEFQAEATAFLVLKELDMLTDEMATVSRGYIQGWLGQQKPSDTMVRQVFKAVTDLVAAGRPVSGDAAATVDTFT